MATQDEIRSQITTQIVDALQSGGIPPWRRPWGVSPNSGFPTNAVSNKRYSGINVLLLRLASMRHEFRSKFWATFQQWTEMGGRVQKRPDHLSPGQWGCQIVFFKPLTKLVTDDKTGEEREKSIPLLRTYTVFNVDQVDGERLDRFRVKDESPTNIELLDFEPAETAIKATSADIRFAGDRAYYSPVGDYMQMPPKHRFQPQHEFYGTMFHELGHWSETRCQWSGSYAEGELRAEIAAAFMLAEVEVPQSEDLSNHHAYLACWLQALQNDSRFIFRAATAASKASDFVLSFSRQPEPEAVEA